ncbi:MAG: iron-sulfur cluster assembly scaffold protein [Nanoarchaeota archaeon]|nr:iron-sulfur cluster assembly scaffold protein [Nanoarchaeota archaeon]
MYSKKVLQHGMKPKNVGEIKDASGVGEVGNLRCGDILKLYIKVKNGRITKICFKTFGCVAAIASSDALCELAKGKTIKDAKKITNKDIINYLGGNMPAVKVHCSVLGQNALKKAIEDYEKKFK